MAFEAIIHTLSDLMSQHRVRQRVVSLYDHIYFRYHQLTLSQLQAIFKAFEFEQLRLVDRLEAFLSAHWLLIRGTLVCYTALPNDDVTRLLCDLATALSEIKNNGRPADQQVSAIELLMPTVMCEPVRDGFGDLRSSASLHAILTTHILGQDGLHLIPAVLFSEISLSLVKDPLKNAYVHDTRQNEHQAYYLEPDEYQRLEQHSIWTQAIADTRRTCESLSHDKSHLLGQLNQLCLALYINSTDGGFGREDNAAGGAYPAIIHFMEYYKALDRHERDRIPPSVNQEIKTLFVLVTDIRINDNATKNMETCIATRRYCILRAMQGHEGLLHQIRQSNQRAPSVIQEAMVEFNRAKQALVNATDFTGRDALPFQLKLLSQLGLSLNQLPWDDLTFFQMITPLEITSLCESAAVRANIAQHMRFIEHWVMFILNTSTDRVRSFLKGAGQELLPLLRIPSYFSALIMSLDREKCQVVCDVFSNHLRAIIKNRFDFCEVLSPLGPEQRGLVFDVMQAQLPGMIRSISDWRAIHDFFVSDAVRWNTFCDVITTRLIGLIQSAKDLYEVTRCMNPELRTVFLDAAEIKLSSLYKKTNPGFAVLQNLSIKQRRVVYDTIQKQGFITIQSYDDLSNILKFMTTIQRTHILHAVENRLRKMIRTSQQFCDLPQDLDAESHHILFRAMKHRLPALIETSQAFCQVMVCLKPNQRVFLFEVMKHRLPDLIHNIQDILNIYADLTWAQSFGAFAGLGQDSSWVLRVMKTPEISGMLCLILILLIAQVVWGAKPSTVASMAVGGAAALAVYSVFASKRRPGDNEPLLLRAMENT